MTNKIVKIAQFIVALSLTSLPSWAHNDALQQTFRAIPDSGILKSTFTQKRYLKGIPYPLPSSGEITLWAGKGVLWRTHTPFPSQMVMNQTGFYYVQGTKKISLFNNGRIGKERAFHESLSTMLEIFSSILKGDFSKIKGFSSSTLAPTTKGATWAVRLAPKGNLIKFIASVDIEGTSNNNKPYVSHISIKRSNGDHDDITLDIPIIYGAQDVSKALTVQERNLLND